MTTISLRTVDDVVDLFDRWGDSYYDDLVTQRDHALQCAALAEQAGADDALVVAALLHDVGHLVELAVSSGAMGDLTIDRQHEATAARMLAPIFPASVTAPIALHVDAKRYLCAVEPAYLVTLSEGSIRSLATQGGPMTADEVDRFAAMPACVSAVALRRWDDLGKVDGLHVPDLAHHAPRLHAVARELVAAAVQLNHEDFESRLRLAGPG